MGNFGLALLVQRVSRFGVTADLEVPSIGILCYKRTRDFYADLMGMTVCRRLIFPFSKS